MGKVARNDEKKLGLAVGPSCWLYFYTRAPPSGGPLASQITTKGN